MAAVTQHPPADVAGVPLLPVAGLGLRFVAFVLDALVVLGLVALFFAIGGAAVIAQGDDPPDAAVWAWFGVTALAFFPVAPLLFAVFWAWRSQSLGMMAVGLILTNRAGYRVSTGRAILRTLFWPLSFLSLGLGLIPMLFDGERRALHDLLAGTVVRELR